MKFSSTVMVAAALFVAGSTFVAQKAEASDSAVLKISRRLNYEAKRDAHGALVKRDFRVARKLRDSFASRILRIGSAEKTVQPKRNMLGRIWSSARSLIAKVPRLSWVAATPVETKGLPQVERSAHEQRIRRDAILCLSSAARWKLIDEGVLSEEEAVAPYLGRVHESFSAKTPANTKRRRNAHTTAKPHGPWVPRLPTSTGD